MPEIPSALLVSAAMIPATKVPWPCWSFFHEPPTKLLPVSILGLRSGCVPSMPESITATRTRGLKGAGNVGQVSNARICGRYHCFAKSGSVGTKEMRREASTRST